MKKNIVKITAVAFVAILASCKGEPKNQTTAEEAVETEEVAEVAGVTYTADVANSSIDWVGAKPAGTHTGTINLSEGAFVMGEEGIIGGEFVIDMNSITVTDLEGDQKANLEAHLKGNAEGKEDHFFNVAQYPTASFEVTGMKTEGEKTMMEGNLTIRGISKNIAFPVSVVNNEDMIEVTSETFTIDRTQWEVNYGSKSIFDNLGDKFINDDIELTIKVTANKG